MNKLRVQLRAHKIMTAVMGLILIAGFGAIAVKADVPSDFWQWAAQAYGNSLANKTETPSVPALSENLGAVSGPDLYSPYWNVNGFRVWPFSTGLMQATTTTETAVSRFICSQKSPNATSTLAFQGTSFKIATTSAATLYSARATTGTATTTAIGTGYAIAAGAQATVFASTTPVTQLIDTAATVFPPNTFFNQSLAGGTGNVTPTGKCTGYFIEFPQ